MKQKISKSQSQNTTAFVLPAPQMVHQMADIGRMVRKQRKDQGLRIDDAAALSHVSVDLLSRLENGQGSVGLEKLLSVLDGMGLCLVVSARSHPALRTLLLAEVKP